MQGMNNSLRPRDLALALLVIVVWGLNFAVIKVGVAGVPPLLLGALRYLLAAFPALRAALPEARLLLVGGGMDRIRNVASFVPTYLLNASDEVVEKYKTANATDASGFNGDVSCYFKQAQPLQKCMWTRRQT